MILILTDIQEGKITQQEHHKMITFREEYEAFIKEMGEEFDMRDWER
jgi:hypothetical protein